MPPQPELPNPAAAEAHFAAAPREFHAARRRRHRCRRLRQRAISEILEPAAAAPRVTIEPELPPDHPLEPGTRPTGRMASPSERIAASESAISEIPASAAGPGQHVEFHRRRAPRRPGRRGRAAQRKGRAAAAFKAAAGDKADEPSTITSKIRSLLVGASVVVIVLGTFKMAMTLLDSGNRRQCLRWRIRASTRRRRSRPPVTAPSPAMPDARLR